MTIYSERSYLQKHRFAERQIQDSPIKGLGIVVVIPCYGEPNLLRTLISLEKCQAPTYKVEVIIVVNASTGSPEPVQELNLRTKALVDNWKVAKKRKFRYHLIHFPDLPAKHAGVGLARKIGMDEAVDRFDRAKRKKGVIACLDADSTVSPDYLVYLEKQFRSPVSSEACSIYFEHPVGGSEFPAEVYKGAVKYELFLRYYIEGLRYAGYPYAFHTIGSSMAVRSDIYQAEGGMNRRKAGEDFYFLHKIIPRGKFTELNKPRVTPSPRPSDKVPFGTGKAIQDWLDSGEKDFPAYDFRVFEDLKAFIREIPYLYLGNFTQKMPPSIQSFLDKENFDQQLPSIRKHVSGLHPFIKRFYTWFHPLRVLKFVHHARDHYYPNVPIETASADLFQKVFGGKPGKYSSLHWLTLYRNWQRTQKFP